MKIRHVKCNECNVTFCDALLVFLIFCRPKQHDTLLSVTELVVALFQRRLVATERSEHRQEIIVAQERVDTNSVMKRKFSGGGLRCVIGSQ